MIDTSFSSSYYQIGKSLSTEWALFVIIHFAKFKMGNIDNVKGIGNGAMDSSRAVSTWANVSGVRWNGAEKWARRRAVESGEDGKAARTNKVCYLAWLVCQVFLLQSTTARVCVCVCDVKTRQNGNVVRRPPLIAAGYFLRCYVPRQNYHLLLRPFWYILGAFSLSLSFSLPFLPGGSGGIRFSSPNPKKSFKKAFYFFDRLFYPFWKCSLLWPCLFLFSLLKNVKPFLCREIFKGKTTKAAASNSTCWSWKRLVIGIGHVLLSRPSALATRWSDQIWNIPFIITPIRVQRTGTLFSFIVHTFDAIRVHTQTTLYVYKYVVQLHESEMFLPRLYYSSTATAAADPIRKPASSLGKSPSSSCRAKQIDADPKKLAASYSQISKHEPSWLLERGCVYTCT